MTLSRIFTRLALVSALFGLSACCLGGGGSKVEVFCKPGGSQVNCDAKQVSGLGNVRACWDIRLACTNGITSVANTCVNIDGTSPTKHQIATSEFQNYAKCVNPSVKAVENVTVKSR